jgi:serine protease
VLPSGRSVLAYDWSIVSGGTNATVTSAANAATATLSGSAQGTVVVRLSLTDDLNSVTTRDVSIAVGGASSSGGGTTPTTPTTTLPQGQSSGGGALGLHWLLGLTLAIVVLAERNRRLRLQKT